MILHGFKLSGHSHRAEMLLNFLQLPYEFRHVDLAGGAQRAPEFLRLNPFGTVPVLEDGDFIIPDSAAILVYLARKYDTARFWLPEDVETETKIQRWLSVAQGPVLNGPAKARMVRHFGKTFNHAEAVGVAQDLLGVLEAELGPRPFLVGAGASLADIAIYSYVAKAPEGAVPLDGFPAVQAWLRRVEALPRFLPMPFIA
ncbi:MAG: glutathione S-transferase [Proteobacteria bacterium]|nr:glutathione S-transferase [Pseudomonadota bacterium]MBU6425764.1 glutathione S-transferase [Rhodospirillales bacterium]